MAEDTIKSIRDRKISHNRCKIELLLKIKDDVDHLRKTLSAMKAMLLDAKERSATSNLIACLKKLEDEEQSVTDYSLRRPLKVKKIFEYMPVDSFRTISQEDCRRRTKMMEKILVTHLSEKMGYAMAELEHQSTSNGSKKRNLNFTLDEFRQEVKRKKKQRDSQYRRQIIPIFYDCPTARGKNNNGKITNWKCELKRMTEMLLSMKTKNVLKATNIGKTKASQQVLCHRNQIKMLGPKRSDLLVTIQVIHETDRKCKDAVLAEAKAKWRLLPIGETIEKLDRQRSEFFLPPPWKVKVTATDDKTRQGVQSKFCDLENQIYDKGNDKVECEDFLGLEQELKKTSWGKVPDYLESIAIQIEKDRGKATDIFHIPTLVLLCAAIKEMKDFSVGDLDLGTLKKWSATLNYGKKYGFQVGFADNLLRKNLLAYFAIQNLPKSAVKI
ncbi:ribosome biogenesis protein RLP24-like [Gossypium australe]|uniref:Ribosome biogenesis protein RLP24-like n=1 Tax=Gossypium australe TaxID=47621 RepID=A0A5B6VSG4_9ROSI|nr:ribosome biogenesis protein RLP24-like [Gossypium australe]